MAFAHDRAETRHSIAKPFRYAAAVKRKISASRTLRQGQFLLECLCLFKSWPAQYREPASGTPGTARVEERSASAIGADGGNDEILVRRYEHVSADVKGNAARFVTPWTLFPECTTAIATCVDEQLEAPSHPGVGAFAPRHVGQGRTHFKKVLSDR
jgi:hypothetical protein